MTQTLAKPVPADQWVVELVVPVTVDANQYPQAKRLDILTTGFDAARTAALTEYPDAEITAVRRSTSRRTFLIDLAAVNPATEVAA